MNGYDPWEAERSYLPKRERESDDLLTGQVIDVPEDPLPDRPDLFVIIGHHRATGWSQPRNNRPTTDQDSAEQECDNLRACDWRGLKIVRIPGDE